MSTNTRRPETRSVLSALSHFYSGTSTYSLVHARAQISDSLGDVKHPRPALGSGSGPGLMDLRFARESNLRLHEPMELQTLTEFSEPHASRLGASVRVSPGKCRWRSCSARPTP
jgi:hypothetical protein